MYKFVYQMKIYFNSSLISFRRHSKVKYDFDMKKIVRGWAGVEFHFWTNFTTHFTLLSEIFIRIRTEEDTSPFPFMGLEKVHQFIHAISPTILCN